MGATDEDIAAATATQAAAATATETADLCLIWESNSASWSAFTGTCTQWQYAGMQGQRTGLLYAGVHTYLQLSTPRRQWRGLFADLQLMESAVLAADDELRDQA